MSSNSTIEWTDATWNPTAGCSIVSPGCTNCYAMKVANGLEGRFNYSKYRGLTKVVNGNAVWTGEVRLDEEALLQPLRWKKPKRIFVNSMSDLFHERLSDADIDRVFAVMALCPQHTFQVLTKRAERMRDYFTKRQFLDVHPLEVRADAINDAMNAIAPAHWCKRELQDYSEEGLPLPNVWLGVSAERQQEADERIPHLLATPAAVRFVSAEPLLGPIDLIGTLARFQDTPKRICAVRLGAQLVDWVITGGESGPHGRPMNPQWAREIRDQCEAAGVAYFHKQNGEFASVSEVAWPGAHFTFDDGRTVRRVGKKAAGRLLDGREWSEFPEAPT